MSAAKTDWIDAILFSYNFRLIQTPKMKEAVAACVDKGIGLVAMKTQGGGQVMTNSEAELQLAGRFLERGFTDKQAKLKAVLENPNIASICSQMPSLTILSANVAAARDQTSLTRRFRTAGKICGRNAGNLLRRVRPHLSRGRWGGGAGQRNHEVSDVLPRLRRTRPGARGFRRFAGSGRAKLRKSIIPARRRLALRNSNIEAHAGGFGDIG